MMLVLAGTIAVLIGFCMILHAIEKEKEEPEAETPEKDAQE